MSETPSALTPQILDGRAFAVVEWGDRVVIGGDFTTVANPGEASIAQANLFAFDKATGRIDLTFTPDLDAGVRAVAVHPDGTSLVVGGEFTTVGGAARRGITRLDAMGDPVAGWIGSTNDDVLDVGTRDGLIYAAGRFSRANGVDRPALATFDATGNLSAETDLGFAAPRNNSTLLVRRIDISPDGAKLAAVGNFGTVDGQKRDQVAVVDLTTSPDSLDPWATEYYDVPCADIIRWPYHVRDVEFSPDSSYLVIANSGGKPVYPHRCDQGARFELDQVGPDVAPTWVTYSGGDSVLAIAATEDAVYLGGHYRWLNNPYGQDEPQPGSVARGTLAALDPLTGLPFDWDPGRSPRGQGVLAIEAVDDGIWIASDTDFLATQFRPRIAFMPLAGGSQVLSGTAPSLPTVLFSVAGGTIRAHTFDGVTVGAATTVISGDSRLDQLTGAALISGALFTTTPTGATQLSWAGTPLGDLPVDLRNLPIPLADIGGFAFDFDLHRMYYTTSDGVLRWRHFEPSQAIFGAEEFTAPTNGVDLTAARGMTIVAGSLIYGSPGGDLRQVAWVDGAPQGTPVVISGPAVDGETWDAPALFALSPGDQFLDDGTGELLSITAFGSDAIDPWQTFGFGVPTTRDLNVAIDVADPAADIRFFLSDPNGTTVASSREPGATRVLTMPDAAPGDWTIGVRSRGAGSGFSISVNRPTDGDPVVSRLASCGSVTSDRWQTLDVAATTGDPITVDLDWDNPNAEIYTFLLDPNGTTIASSRSNGTKPRQITATANTTGTYTAAINVKADAACFDLIATVGDTGGGANSVERLSACGSVTANGWQTLDVAAATGDPITVDLDWDNPNAEIYAFLLDPNGTTIASSRSNGTKPRQITATANTTGTYTAAINVKADAACFDLTATVGAGNQAPTIEPLADLTARLGLPVNLPIVAADADGDTLSFAATGLPAGVAIDPATGLISGTPTALGSSAVTVAVADGTTTAQTTFSLTVVADYITNGSRLAFRSVTTGGYLDAPASTATTSASLSASAVWLIEDPEGDGRMGLRNEARPIYLDGDADAVDIFINAARDDRQWYLEEVTPGRFYIRNAADSLGRPLVEARALGAQLGWDTAPAEDDDLWEIIVNP